MPSNTIDELYLKLISHWLNPEELVINSNNQYKFMVDNNNIFHQLDATQRMMALDILTYLPDDILVKVNRAAMGVSLETRVPLLDHRVVEFAWRLPQSMKFRDGLGKWILRQVLYRYVTKSLIERPKMGFGVPLGAWLRGPLRDWAESLLSASRLQRNGQNTYLSNLIGNISYGIYSAMGYTNVSGLKLNFNN